MSKRSSQKRQAVLLIVTLLLFIRPVWAGDRAQPESSKAPRLLLVWHDAHRLYPGTHGGVAREVASLFAPLEAEIHWERAEGYDPQLDETTILLRIVLMPSDPAGAGWGLGRDVMGAAFPTNGRVRSVYIFYNTLVRGLKIRAQQGRLPDFNERRLLEKALGRVVAHEMIHSLAPSFRHTGQGLMRSGVNRSYLARQDVVLAAPVKQAFYAGVKRVLSTTPAPPGLAIADGAAPRAVRHVVEPSPGGKAQ